MGAGPAVQGLLGTQVSGCHRTRQCKWEPKVCAMCEEHTSQSLQREGAWPGSRGTTGNCCRYCRLSQPVTTEWAVVLGECSRESTEG